MSDIIKLYLKIWGILKIIVGCLLITLMIIAIPSTLSDESSQISYWTGIVLGLLSVFYYGFYLIRSGWIDYKLRLFKKRIFIWLSLGVGVIFSIIFLFLILNDTVSFMIGFILLICFMIPSFIDVLKMLRQPLKPTDNET
jgi:hypothetical protein